MASISTTSSVSQYGWQQLKLQQAQRNADQAELTAEALKAQASDAQRVADRAQEHARSLAVQSDQAQTQAGRLRQGLAALNSAQQAFAQLPQTINQAIVPAQTSAAAIQSSSTQGVTNTQGQVTGTIVNTTA